ncbi:Hypothetical protein ADU71_0219 [Pediococcus damnosus]|uniref:C39 family peptidase n=1 Tax=Pediococcus damnosus TaxID=51663 RepID=UPI00078B4F3B|nr:C39 family peptidase [Pediococcus damnosus]AMV64142.1 Hypothetical protein ADU71_0219 [Pediococcus damnosus]
MLKRFVLISVILFSCVVSGQSVYADSDVSSVSSSQASMNSSSDQNKNSGQASSSSSVSKAAKVITTNSQAETSAKSTSSFTVKSSSQFSANLPSRSVSSSSSSSSSSKPVTKKYIALNKATKVKPKAYVSASKSGALYNFTGSGTHGQFSKSADQLNNHLKTTWIVTQYRYVSMADHKPSLYYFVKSETGPQNGWVWHSYLKEKAVQTKGPVLKVKKASYYRKTTSGNIYNISGPTYDAKFKVSHVLRNYPNTTWYVTKKMQVTNTKKHAITYYYVQDSKKHTGWIWNGYLTKKVILNVKRISQNPQLPTGCEITAVTMMVNYAGAKVSKMKLAKEMPRTKTKNGNKGFVGSPYSKYGWWIYPPALMKTVKKYTKSAINMTGASFDAIKKQINKKHPVVVWLSGYGGISTKINHAITIIGYSASLVYFNDPWTGKRLSMSIDKLHSYRKRDAYRAISY